MEDNIFGNGFDPETSAQPAPEAPQGTPAPQEAPAQPEYTAQPEAPASPVNVAPDPETPAEPQLRPEAPAEPTYAAEPAPAEPTYAPAEPAPAQSQAYAAQPQGFAQPQNGNFVNEGDGRYSMVHPAGGTTYFRAPAQGANNLGAQQNFAPNGAQPQNPYGAPYGAQTPFGAQNAGQNPYAGYTGYTAAQPEPEKKKKKEKEKKAKKGASLGAVALICAIAVVLSGLAAYGGVLLANRQTGNAGGTQNTTPDTAVIYRSVNTDEDIVGDATYHEVVEAVADSVVEINTEFTSTGFFQYVTSGAGSGVIIDSNGYVVTNNHVITDGSQQADAVKVRLTDGTEYDATVVGTDADTDIAVLKIDAKDLTVAVFADSDKLVVGQDIVAIGNPLGELGGTVTEGIISALDREVDVDGVKMNLLQFSAAVNPGNSGGGLFNMKGELVGIVNAKSSGSGIEGLGFAIPANDACHIATELMKNGYVTGKTYIGISLYYTADAFTAYRYFGSQNPGLFVYEIVEGYNDKVLKQGDRLIAVNGDEVSTSDDVKQILKECSVGDKLKFSIYREGKLMEVEVTVYEYVPDKTEVEFDN